MHANMLHLFCMQVIVWDFAALLTGRSSSGGLGSYGAGVTRETAILARQLSDFDITRLKFSPFDKRQLVSCGRENVRFWRIRYEVRCILRDLVKVNMLSE